jgi:septal ring factor EnvC (AmiA/AmiB activator)
MERSIDEIYTAIISLSRQITDLAPDDPRRARLERERNGLRSLASEIADSARHPKSVELEIESAERRLAEIDALLIREGYMERRGGKNIQDPGAYSATINHLLSEQHAQEIEDLTRKLERLRSLADDPGTHP